MELESRWNADGCSLCLCVKRAKRKCATAVQGVEGQNNFREEEEEEEEEEKEKEKRGIERGRNEMENCSSFPESPFVRACVG